MFFPRSQFAIDVVGKFDEEVQQCPPTRLTQQRASSLSKGIPRMRLPCSRDQAATELGPIQSPLRTSRALASVVSHKISHDRMMCSRPESAAFALVVADFISKLGVAQRRQAVCDDELSLARREAFCISSPAIVPLRRDSTSLVNPGDECPLEIRARRRQCLLEIHPLPLWRSQ